LKSTRKLRLGLSQAQSALAQADQSIQARLRMKYPDLTTGGAPLLNRLLTGCLDSALNLLLAHKFSLSTGNHSRAFVSANLNDFAIVLRKTDARAAGE
jgi:hypothetical protein